MSIYKDPIYRQIVEFIFEYLRQKYTTLLHKVLLENQSGKGWLIYTSINIYKLETSDIFDINKIIGDNFRLRLIKKNTLDHVAYQERYTAFSKREPKMYFFCTLKELIRLFQGTGNKNHKSLIFYRIQDNDFMDTPSSVNLTKIQKKCIYSNGKKCILEHPENPDQIGYCYCRFGAYCNQFPKKR